MGNFAKEGRRGYLANQCAASADQFTIDCWNLLGIQCKKPVHI
jgi:hypothetical protein